MPRARKGNFSNLKGPTLPTSIRCEAGGEWKPLNAFSDTQQQHARNQIDSLRPFNAAQSGMICKDHRAGAGEEVQCVLCGLTKHRNAFSKASRKNQDFRCMQCTAWVENQEPNVVPTPLGTGHVSVEEETNNFWGLEPMLSTDFFPDDIAPQAPISSLAALGLNNLDGISESDVNDLLSASSVTNSAAISGGSMPLPPHIPKPKSVNYASSVASGSHFPSKQSDVSSTSSVDARSKVVGTRSSSFANLPPHLVSRALSSASVSSVRTARSISTATTIREEKDEIRRGKQVAYNAWDPSGTHHQAIKAPSVLSSVVSSSAISEASSSKSSAVRDWKITPATMTPISKKGGWAKGERIRLVDQHLPSFQDFDADVDRQRRRINIYDSDSD